VLPFLSWRSRMRRPMSERRQRHRQGGGQAGANDDSLQPLMGRIISFGVAAKLPGPPQPP
jgi:hypothetical protein